jgi:hypothetical protein
MTRTQKKCAFAEAVLAMLEGATLHTHRRTDWFSATFVGERHALTLHLTGDDAEQRTETFAQAITEREFALPRWLVADIVVTRIAAVREGTEVLVEALLLEE